MITGRGPELEAIANAVGEAEAGRPSSLLIVGDPGMGKTTLLEQIRRANRTVLTTTGVESESEFPFANLHELLQPTLNDLDRIPRVQADALSAALAISESSGSAPLTVGAGVLSLLALLSEERTVLVLIDDAQWLDASSASAISFAARRLRTERVAVIATTDDPELVDRGTFGGVLRLEGIDDGAATTLLASVANDMAPLVVCDLNHAVGGNPGALLEAASMLTPQQRAGIELLPRPVPVRTGVPRRLAVDLDELSPAGRQALLRASVAGTNTFRVIERTQVSVDEGMTEAEAAGLVTLTNGRFTFGHRLTPAQVVETASPEERRAAHREIAQSLAEEGRLGELRLWHLAAAACGSDEELAKELARGAEQISHDRGHGSAVSLYEAASRLTESKGLAFRWSYQAARCAWLSGQPTRATRLAERITFPTQDPALDADVSLLWQQLAWSGAARLPSAVERAPKARESLQTALQGPSGAWTVRLHSLRAAELGQDDGAYQAALKDCGGLAWDAAPGEEESLLEVAHALTSWTPAFAPVMRSVCDRLVAEAHRSVAAALASAELARAHFAFSDGRWDDAVAGYLAARGAARDTGQPQVAASAQACLLMVDALRDSNRESTAPEVLPGAVQEAIAGARDMTAGRFSSVISRSESVRWSELSGWLPPDSFSLVDRIEALTKSSESVADTLDAATSGTLRLADRAWIKALADDETGVGVTVAIQRFGGAERPTLPVARLLLLQGQRLRRQRNRSAAREPLRAALETFGALGAAGWAEQARQELVASGATAAPARVSGLSQLTPQELAVARCIASGATYREAAAQLYLSPKTIEFHLSRIYRKLGISSRRDLTARMAEMNSP